MQAANWFINGFEKMTGENWIGATLQGVAVSPDECRAALLDQVASNSSTYFPYGLTNEQSDVIHAAEWLVRNAARTNSSFFNSLRSQFAATGHLSCKQINCCRFRK